MKNLNKFLKNLNKLGTFQILGAGGGGGGPDILDPRPLDSPQNTVHCNESTFASPKTPSSDRRPWFSLLDGETPSSDRRPWFSLLDGETPSSDRRPSFSLLGGETPSSDRRPWFSRLDGGADAKGVSTPNKIPLTTMITFLQKKLQKQNFKPLGH